MLEISSFYACVPKTTITWGSVPEIQSERYFLLSWAILYPFTPLLMPKIKIWKKCKKIGYIIFLHMCAINEDHMMYGCWDIRQDIFFLFYSSSTLTTQKIKILKKWKKKNGEISSFHTSILKTIIICYTVLQIWCMTDVTVIFHFGLFFVLSTPTPNSPKIPYQKKEEKKHLDISSFYTSVPKIMIRLCTAPEIRCVTDKHTGR